MPKEIQPGKVYGITDDYMFFTVMQDKTFAPDFYRNSYSALEAEEFGEEGGVH